LSLLLIVAGCAGSTSGGGSHATPADPPPSVYVFDTTSTPTPTASLDDIKGALQNALDSTMTIDVSPVEAAYNKAMLGSTSQCPYVYDNPQGSYWYDSCTADDGSKFDGYVFAYAGTAVPDPYNAGMLDDYWYAYGGATVVDSSAHQLELAGDAVWYKVYSDDFAYYYTQVNGTFSWNGPEAKDTWLEDGLDPDLTVTSQVVPSVGATSITLDGGFGGLPNGWAVAYDQNSVIDENLFGGLCSQELSGTVGVRAPDGTWYDIQFQGWDGISTDYDASGCDGCGDVYYEGVSIGQACPDLSKLMAQAVAQ
jgi:hypothetical protein